MKSTKERLYAFIEKYYRLNRTSVCDEVNMISKDIALETGAQIISVPSGEEIFTWFIPPKWSVNHAYLESINGKRLANFHWNKLYLKSYSVPFKGEISRKDLMEHIQYDEQRPESIIYDYRQAYQFGEKTQWGFCLPYNLVKTLNEEKYYVNIDTEICKGTLDIVDWKISGSNPNTIFFGAHTCHPEQVNDGLANVAVIMELFYWLKKKQNRRYTYRAIIGPEYFTALTFLKYAKDVDSLKYGFYLDMLGNNEKLGVAQSFIGNSIADQITHNVLKNNVSDYVKWLYRGKWGNDELFYDGPDYEIPTVCIARDYYEAYHTDRDNLENCNFNNLEISLELLKKIINVFESDCIPERLYKGPVYLSRYNFYKDPYEDEEGYNNLQKIQILMDGKHSCLDIALQLDVDYEFVRNFVEGLKLNNLVQYQYDNIRY